MTDAIFIGYDAREDLAAQVAAYSIVRRATNKTKIYALEHRLLRSLGLFTRPWTIDEAGQYRDWRDGRPFSTEFSHSRFLVFHLARELKFTGPCMFVDCDWLFQSDPSAILNKQRDQTGIGVVSRHRKVEEDSLKMDGMVQQNYDRKLWSAMFTFTPSDTLAKMFNPDVVNNMPGRMLHAFKGMNEDSFWEIDPDWHYIPSLDPECDSPRGIHFSEFSPWLNPEKYPENMKVFDAWEKERASYYEYRAGSGADMQLFSDLKLDLQSIIDIPSA